MADIFASELKPIIHHRESGFTDTPRSGERDQAHVFPPKQVGDGHDLVLTTDERAQQGGESDVELATSLPTAVGLWTDAIVIRWIGQG